MRRSKGAAEEEADDDGPGPVPILPAIFQAAATNLAVSEAPLREAQKTSAGLPAPCSLRTSRSGLLSDLSKRKSVLVSG